MLQRPYMHASLLVRDLPKLQDKTTSSSSSTTTTTTSTSTTSTSTTSLTSPTTSSDEDVTTHSNTLSATATTTTLSSTTSKPTSLVASTIQPPSAENNPFIYRSRNLPDGTVFIAVGAVAGFIFLCIIIWWSVTKYLSQRYSKLTSKYYNNHNDNFVFKDWNPNNNGKPFRILSDSSSMGTDKSDYVYVVDEKYHSGNNNSNNKNNNTNKDGKVNDEITNIDSSFVSQAPFTPIQNEYYNNYYNNYPHNTRNSLFISPTLQITQQQQNGSSMTTSNSMVNMQQNVNRNSVLSLISNSDELDDNPDNTENNFRKPERLASPERQKKLRERSYKRDSPHKRNGSQLNFKSSPSKLDFKSGGNHDEPTTNNNSNNNYNNIQNMENSVSKNPSDYLNELLDGIRE